MRAICEACEQPQPVDWKPGDLCTGCGATVRRDVRCFWCAQWTPFAKFCRGCGAEVVDERVYGAARMIKEAGTDRFTVPKMLRELDPEQVENFTRIYQRHAVTANSHVEDLRCLERHLHHCSFSTALADELIPQLPWPAKTLESMTMPPRREEDGLAMIAEIGARTPFGQTRELAAVLRARFGDISAMREAAAAMRSPSPEIRDEAALALSSWRVTTGNGLGNVHRTVVEHLRASTFTVDASVGLALLRAAEPETAREGMRAADPDTVFGAALAVGDVPHLRDSLRSGDVQRTAAAVRLIDLGVLEPIEPLLREGSPELQLALTDALARREGGAGILADALLHLVESTTDESIRERAARVLCRAMKPEIALRVARVGKEDQHIIQSMLSEGAALPSSTVAEVCRYLAAQGHLRFGQYGVEEAAKRGAIPDRFVPSCFHDASDETRGQLLRIAEIQLEARAHEELHRFVLRCVFGPYSGTIRAAAWWSLSRWYRQQDRRSSGPFSLSTVPIERFFGSVDAFTPRLIAVLGDHASLVEVGLYEFLAHLLGTAEPTAVQAMMNDGEQTRSLLTALEAIARGTYWTYLRTAVIAFLESMATHPDFRKPIEDTVRHLSTTSDGDVRMSSLRLLEKLASPAS